MSTLPIEREYLTDQAAKELIARIVQGGYRPGERLPPERRLSQELNVSRGTLRDCLAKLETLGLIETKRSSGTYVREVDLTRIPTLDHDGAFPSVHLDDILFAREAIEIPAFQLACANKTPEDIARLEELLDNMRNSMHSIDQFIEYDMEFHRAIVRAGKNYVLLVAFDAIWEFHRFSQIYTSFKQHEMENTIAHHERILAEFKADRTRLGPKVLYDHFSEMRRYLNDVRGEHSGSPADAAAESTSG